MSVIHWKRGIPTEEECREWTIVDGGDRDEPSPIDVHGPGETYTGDWTDGWYAAVRILPPESEKPAEDPEEWVTQDRVPMRSGIDRGWWESVPLDVAEFWTATECHQGLCHGQLHKSSGQTVLHVRCRRRDLPTAEPVIREFRNTETEGPQPGQFYENEVGKRRKIIGVTQKGMFAIEFDYGEVLTYSKEYIAANWTHLKDCTGWEWEEPKKTKTQRRWVCDGGEAWIDVGVTGRLPLTWWSSTDDVREVPVNG